MGTSEEGDVFVGEELILQLTKIITKTGGERPA